MHINLTAQEISGTVLTLLPASRSVTLLHSPQCGAARCSLAPTLGLPACIIKLTNAVCVEENTDINKLQAHR